MRNWTGKRSSSWTYFLSESVLSTTVLYGILRKYVVVDVPEHQLPMTTNHWSNRTEKIRLSLMKTNGMSVDALKPWGYSGISKLSFTKNVKEILEMCTIYLLSWRKIQERRSLYRSAEQGCAQLLWNPWKSCKRFCTRYLAAFQIFAQCC